MKIMASPLMKGPKTVPMKLQGQLCMIQVSTNTVFPINCNKSDVKLGMLGMAANLRRSILFNLYLLKVSLSVVDTLS